MPLTDSSHIDVYELMPGVVADPSEVKLESRIAQCQCGDARDADIDGVAEDVLAVRRYAARRSVKECIGLWRAISANDIDGAAWMTNGFVELVEQVEETRIHIAILMNAPVPEEAIELYLRRRQVVISPTVDNVETATRVQVEQHKAVVFDRGRLSCGWKNR